MVRYTLLFAFLAVVLVNSSLLANDELDKHVDDYVNYLIEKGSRDRYPVIAGQFFILNSPTNYAYTNSNQNSYQNIHKKLLSLGISGVVLDEENFSNINKVSVSPLHKQKIISSYIEALQFSASSNFFPPLFVATDHENQRINRFHLNLAAPINPFALNIASQNGFDIQDYGEVTGFFLRKLGVNMLLGPVLDFEKCSSSGKCLFNDNIFNRYYSNFPEQIDKSAVQFSKGISKYHIHQVMKHFPGLRKVESNLHHDSEHLSSQDCETILSSINRFIKLKNNIDFIMTSHVSFDYDHYQKCKEGVDVSKSKIKKNIYDTSDLKDFIIEQGFQDNLIISDELNKMKSSPIYGFANLKNDKLLDFFINSLGNGHDLFLMNIDYNKNNDTTPQFARFEEIIHELSKKMLKEENKEMLRAKLKKIIKSKYKMFDDIYDDKTVLKKLFRIPCNYKSISSCADEFPVNIGDLYFNPPSFISDFNTDVFNFVDNYYFKNNIFEKSFKIFHASDVSVSSMEDYTENMLSSFANNSTNSCFFFLDDNIKEEDGIGEENKKSYAGDDKLLNFSHPSKYFYKDLDNKSNFKIFFINEMLEENNKKFESDLSSSILSERINKCDIFVNFLSYDKAGNHSGVYLLNKLLEMKNDSKFIVFFNSSPDVIYSRNFIGFDKIKDGSLLLLGTFSNHPYAWKYEVDFLLGDTKLSRDLKYIKRLPEKFFSKIDNNDYYPVNTKEDEATSRPKSTLEKRCNSLKIIDPSNYRNKLCKLEQDKNKNKDLVNSLINHFAKKIREYDRNYEVSLSREKLKNEAFLNQKKREVEEIISNQKDKYNIVSKRLVVLYLLVVACISSIFLFFLHKKVERSCFPSVVFSLRYFFINYWSLFFIIFSSVHDKKSKLLI